VVVCLLKASRNVRQLRSGAVQSFNLFTTTITTSDCLVGTPTTGTTSCDQPAARDCQDDTGLSCFVNAVSVPLVLAMNIHILYKKLTFE